VVTSALKELVPWYLHRTFQYGPSNESADHSRNSTVDGFFTFVLINSITIFTDPSFASIAGFAPILVGNGFDAEGAKELSHRHRLSMKLHNFDYD
jgi:hypothetical protein